MNLEGGLNIFSFLRAKYGGEGNQTNLVSLLFVQTTQSWKIWTFYHDKFWFADIFGLFSCLARANCLSLGDVISQMCNMY